MLRAVLLMEQPDETTASSARAGNQAPPRDRTHVKVFMDNLGKVLSTFEGGDYMTFGGWMQKALVKSPYA
jgi:hypothetical protein